MQLNNCEINILIKGRKATEFKSPMDFQTYIEGRDASEFEIEFVNNNSVDVEAILSVDGLSITDGKPAGSQSSGYMVPARQRVTVSGWTLDKASVAKFFFAGAKGGSYAEQVGEDSRHKGVIGAKVFGRKYVPSHSFTIQTSGIGHYPAGMRGVTLGGGLTKGLGNSYSAMGMNSVTASNCVGAASASASPISYAADSMESVTLTSAPAVEQTLGTGFGDATEFKTTTVDFERGDLLALFELFYDDAQGLKRRGIDVRASTVRPSAFPADEPKGCAPPANWSR